MLLVAFTSLGLCQESGPPANKLADEYRIPVDVNLVVLPVTVRERNGGFVSGLKRDNFRVFENGAEQEIKNVFHEDIPVTAGLVVDSSGSMRTKLPEVAAAALTFARSSNKRDEMFVVKFNEKVSMGLPDGVAFTDQEYQLDAAFSKIVANGKTALYDAISLALEHLRKGQWSKKVLIVVSDGGDNASRLSRDQVMALARHSNAIIYTIGLFDEDDPDRNPGVLNQLAKISGGEAFFPEMTREAVAICKQIAVDIRNQYTIEYIPRNQQMDGTYRAIRVAVSAPGRRRLIVRTRAGYTAPVANNVTAHGTYPMPK